jgi:divalent metal cation (Fe/Co/Zn/Cd) transporter
VVVVRNAARDVYRRLMDGVDPAVVEEVTAVVGETPGVEAVEAVRARWIGHDLHVEADEASSAELSLAAAHDIAEEVRHRLLHRVPRLASATIHSGPAARGGDPHARTAHHRPGH